MMRHPLQTVGKAGTAMDAVKGLWTQKLTKKQEPNPNLIRHRIAFQIMQFFQHTCTNGHQLGVKPPRCRVPMFRSQPTADLSPGIIPVNWGNYLRPTISLSQDWGKDS